MKAEATGGQAPPKMGRSAHVSERRGLRYSNDVASLLALFAAVALVPAQPPTIAVIDTGANLRVPELAARQPATYDVRTRGRVVRDLNGHGTFTD